MRHTLLWMADWPPSYCITDIGMEESNTQVNACKLGGDGPEGDNVLWTVETLTEAQSVPVTPAVSVTPSSSSGVCSVPKTNMLPDATPSGNWTFRCLWFLSHPIKQFFMIIMGVHQSYKPIQGGLHLTSVHQQENHRQPMFRAGISHPPICELFTLYL